MAVYNGPKFGTGRQPKQGVPGPNGKRGGPNSPAIKANSKPGKPRPEVATTNGVADGLAGAGKGITRSSNMARNKAVAAAKGHAAAVTKGGAAAASTDPLAPLTPAQIKQQAQKTIGAAYGSSFGDLNSEGSRLSAINAKRAQDNTVYQNWATGQENSILAQGSASDANFQAALGSANQALAGAAPSSAALVAQADNRQGNVSNNATSTAIGAGGAVDQNTAAVNGKNAIGDIEDLSNVKDSGDLLRDNVINANSRIGDNEAGQTATFQQQLSDIATQRSKLQLSKAGDIAKEIARLQGVEIQKAQNAQQLSLAQQTLGASVANNAAQNANTRLQILAGTAQAKLQAKQFFATLNGENYRAKLSELGANQRAQLEATTQLNGQQLEAMARNKTFLLEQKKLGFAQAVQNYKEANPNAGNTPANAGNPGNSPLTANEQTEIVTKVQTTVGTINGLFAHFGIGSGVAGGDTKVYQALANGTPIQVGADSAGKPVYHTYAPVPPAILNAAFDLSHFREGKGGLSSKDIAKLRGEGLRNVTSRLG